MAKKQNLEWHNEKRRVSDLIKCPTNPNINTESEFSNLKKSFKNSGYAETIVINTDGMIMAGAHRHQALMEMGMSDKEIDVRVPNRKLSQKEFDRYLLASNALRGSWNFDALRQFDTELILDIGFHPDELQNLWDDHLEIEDGDLNEEKEIEKAKDTKIKVGDYFALGRHRLLCSDAIDPASVKKLMGNIEADVFNDDFPFNIGLRYDQNFTGKKKFGGKTDDNKSDKEYESFLKSLIKNALSVMKPDAHFFGWCDERYVWLLQQLYREFGIDSKRILIWIKNNMSPTPRLAFNKVTEFVVYGTVGSPYLNDRVKNLHEIINRDITSGNRLHDDILDLLNIWLVKRLPGNEKEHPTMKPPSLYEKCLRRCTKPGDVVLDLTAGSGSLLLACEQMKRTAMLCEVEPIFCQIILNRFKKISNEPIKKLN